ncbi:MAG TPA: YafY family protein [Ktedonobacteraceae bacterium]|nr:YafY family protein [Ktedonobacteraceae bacterium]
MTYSPVTRLLTALDLLQSRPGVTAAQLAERLEVEARSVRRYITMLQEIGIPVEAVRGRYGGYRLRPGFKLPPLMWTEEEALAVTLGLQAVQQLGLSQTVPTVESALAKVERVLPQALRERVQAVQETVVLDLVTHGRAEQSAYVMRLSTAAYQRKRVWLRYQSHPGAENEREFDCYGLVYHSQRWYAIGYCHLRQDTRIFRLDRIRTLEAREERFTPPAHFDCLAYTIQAFAAMPSRWLAEVLLQTSLEQIREAVPATFATLEETPAGIFLRAYDDDLQHTARFLVNLGCPFRVLQPPELIKELRVLAEHILAMTISSEDQSPGRSDVIA